MDAATLVVLLMNGELLTSDKQPLASDEASYTRARPPLDGTRARVASWLRTI